MSEEKSEFSALYRREYAAVLRFCARRCSPAAQAEDVTHEVFAVAWRRFAELPPEALAVRAWLFTVARNQLSNLYRREHRASRLRRLIEPQVVPVVPPAEEAVTLRSDLAAAWAALSDADREVIALTAWDELSSQQAATVLGIAAPAYRRRLARARSRLRAAYEIDQPALADTHQRNVSSRQISTNTQIGGPDVALCQSASA